MQYIILFKSTLSTRHSLVHQTASNVSMSMCHMSCDKIPIVLMSLCGCRQSQPMPSMHLQMAAPEDPRQRLRLCLLDSTGCQVACWLPPTDAGGSCQEADGHLLVYQQTVFGESGLVPVSFGAESFSPRHEDIWVALPAPGEWCLKVWQCCRAM